MPVSIEQIKEKRFKRGKAMDEARAIVAKAEAEGRSLSQLTAEEKTNFTKYSDEMRSLKAEIELEERDLEVHSELTTRDREASSDLEKRRLEIEAELRAGSNKKGEPPIPGGHSPEEREKLAKLEMEKRAKEYRNNFAKYLAGRASLLEVRDLQKDVSTAGGYLVAPELMANDLIANVTDLVQIRKLARQFTLASAGSLGVPRLKTRMASATWGSELTTAASDQTLDFGKRNFFPHPGSAKILVSRDLLGLAAIDPESIVRSELARVIAELEENGFMTGDGVQKPLGLFTASSDGIDTDRDISTDNTTSGVTFDGLKRAKRKVKPQYQARCRWLFHPDVVLQASLLKDGQGRYIWQEGGQLGDPDMILGRPVVESYFAPNTMTTGKYVGMYGDFSEYQIVDTLQLSIVRADELYLETNQVLFLARFHVDGAPRISEAFARVQLA